MSETARGIAYPASWNQNGETPSEVPPLSIRGNNTRIEVPGDHTETLPQTGEVQMRCVGNNVVHLTQRGSFYEAVVE